MDSLSSPRVMSGIITGPHFRKYFNQPGSIETGTMVAVLEIGAEATRTSVYVITGVEIDSTITALRQSH